VGEKKRGIINRIKNHESRIMNSDGLDELPAIILREVGEVEVYNSYKVIKFIKLDAGSEIS